MPESSRHRIAGSKGHCRPKIAQIIPEVGGFACRRGLARVARPFQAEVQDDLAFLRRGLAVGARQHRQQNHIVPELSAQALELHGKIVLGPDFGRHHGLLAEKVAETADQKTETLWKLTQRVGSLFKPKQQ